MERFLIVDDDKDTLDTFRLFLEAEHHRLDTCMTTVEAEKLLASHDYCAVFIDIYLPDRNGLDFIKELQTSSFIPAIVVITGSSELTLVKQALRLGVFDYLNKPFRLEGLRVLIKNVIIHQNLARRQRLMDKKEEEQHRFIENLFNQKVRELEESEKKYQKLVEQPIVGVFILQDHKFVYCNQKMKEMLGLIQADRDCPEADFFTFMSSEDVPEIEDKLTRLTNGKLDGPVYFRSQIRPQAGNREHFVEIWAHVFLFQGKAAIQGIAADITERISMEKRQYQLELQLINEHKLAAIGELASGIAHNLNTPIAVIQGNAELLQLKYPYEESLDKILLQTNKLSELIELIVHKAINENNPDTEPLNINQLIENELKFLNAHLFFKHKVNKQISLDPKLPIIAATYSDFSQSITGIMRNLIDDMQDTDEKILKVSTRMAGSSIQIELENSCRNYPEQGPGFYDVLSGDSLRYREVDHPEIDGKTLHNIMAKILLARYKAGFTVIRGEKEGIRIRIDIPLNKN